MRSHIDDVIVRIRFTITVVFQYVEDELPIVRLVHRIHCRLKLSSVGVPEHPGTHCVPRATGDFLDDDVHVHCDLLFPGTFSVA